MNNASQWRLELARQIAPYYARQAGLRMFVAGGSAARGLADAYSDLDLVAYWDTLDDIVLEPPPLEGPGIQRFTFLDTVPGGARLEQYFIGSLKVDIGHVALPWWEQQVADVLEHADTDPEKQDMLGGFLAAVPLQGEETYATWQTRIAAYPDALALAMVRQHLLFYPTWVLEQHDLARGELLSFYDDLCAALKNLVGVLAGLNHRYVSTSKPKHLGAFLDELSVCPTDSAIRIPALLTMERALVPVALASLVAELLDLVETHLPEVDLQTARWLFGFQMPPSEEAPLLPPRS